MDPLKNFTDMLNADKNVSGEFKKAARMTGIEQYNQYKNNGGSMSFTEWYADGRYDRSLEPETPNPHGYDNYCVPETNVL